MQDIDAGRNHHEIEASPQMATRSGFEFDSVTGVLLVFVVSDATAATIDPDLGDGYQTAVVNFNFIASKVWTTREAVDVLQAV